jgi:hypothetical protein
VNDEALAQWWAIEPKEKKNVRMFINADVA